jgi:predicted enzyme related to lactoylglutathione lyase
LCISISGAATRRNRGGFYETLFDWRSEPYGPHSARLNTEADRGIGGSITSLGHEPHNYVMLYVDLENILEYLTKAEAMGGKTVMPETNVPGGGRFAWLSDPDGNLVALWCPDDKPPVVARKRWLRALTMPIALRPPFSPAILRCLEYQCVIKSSKRIRFRKQVRAAQTDRHHPRRHRPTWGDQSRLENCLAQVQQANEGGVNV